MLVFFVFQDRDEQLVAFLVHAIDATLLILEELREYGVRIAQGRFVYLQSLLWVVLISKLGIRVIWTCPVHEIAQALEQIELQEEITIVFVSRKV